MTRVHGLSISKQSILLEQYLNSDCGIVFEGGVSPGH